MKSIIFQKLTPINGKGFSKLIPPISKAIIIPHNPFT
jgi:hypothetical protein